MLYNQIMIDVIHSNWLQHPKRVFKKHINDKLSWKILIIMDNVYKGFSFSICFTIVTLILIVTFRPHTAGLHHRLRVKHDRDIWLSWTQTSAISEHANKTGHYPLWDEVKQGVGRLGCSSCSWSVPKSVTKHKAIKSFRNLFAKMFS